MVRTCLVALLALLALAPVSAHAQRRKPIAVAAPVKTVVTPLASGTATRPIAFEKMVIALNRGDPFGTQTSGLLCLWPQPVSWRAGRADVSGDDFDAIFREELDRAGFRVAGDPTNLFETTSRGDSEFAVAGRITKVSMKVCYPYSGLQDYSSFSGSGSMEVEWQIYSRVEQRVVGKILTSGAHEQKSATSSMPDSALLEEAFAETVRKLASAPEFRSVFIGSARPSDERVSAPTQEILKFTAASSQTIPIPDAVGSVVAIFTGGGHGSGFLVSSDGHLITNNHVVGDSKYVKVRWSDGFETLGEVIRTDKRRDVALVKTDPRGRSPLPLRTSSVSPGEDVYAIGAPMDPKLQNTVTRGIASANRIIDGFSFLQSDVSVVGGNSGGPLIDKDGRVVAICVVGFSDEQGRTGINLFIPVRDAMDFLAVKVD